MTGFRHCERNEVKRGDPEDRYSAPPFKPQAHFLVRFATLAMTKFFTR
jgi:hypothetical protein